MLNVKQNKTKILPVLKCGLTKNWERDQVSFTGPMYYAQQKLSKSPGSDELQLLKLAVLPQV